MPCPKSTFFGRVEVEFWGARAEGSGHARSGVIITSQVDAEAEEYGKNSVQEVPDRGWGVPPMLYVIPG